MRSCSRSLAGVCATVRLGGRAGGLRGGFEPAEIPAGRQSKGQAQQGGRSPKAVAFPFPLPSRNPCHVTHSFFVELAPSNSICPPRTNAIRGPVRCSTKPRTRIRRFSKDLGAMPAASKDASERLEIVTA